MHDTIVRWLAPPVFEGDEDRTRTAALLNGMLLLALPIAAFAALASPITNLTLRLAAPAVVVGLLVVLRLGYVRISAIACVSAMWFGATFLVLSQGAQRTAAVPALCLSITAAGLLLGKGATVAFGALSVLTVVGAYGGEQVGLALSTAGSPLAGGDVAMVVVVLGVLTALLYVAVQHIDEGLAQARRNADGLVESNRELQEVRISLERRVSDRVHDLQSANEVSRLTTEVLDLDRLLPLVVELVQSRFGLYYVGVFLLDEDRRSAVLRAGTGEAGAQMLEQGWSLRVGSDSMVGRCVSREEAYIAHDVGEDAVHFDNPFLPDTRSEMALPLRARGRMLGVMTVQSTETSRFDQGDVAVMQGIADQVAMAIDNAQLFAESQDALREMEAAQRRFASQAWTEYLRMSEARSYETEQAGTPSLGEGVLPEVQHALAEGGVTAMQRTAADDSNPVQRDYAALVAPVSVRGQVIGVVGIHADDEGRQWTEDDLALVEAVVERMGVTAENLRLLDDTQRREANERMVRQIADRMRRAPDMDTLIKTTVQAMAAALGTSDAFLQLAPSPERTTELGGQDDRGSRIG